MMSFNPNRSYQLSTISVVPMENDLLSFGVS